MSVACRLPWTGARVVSDGQSLNNQGAMPLIPGGGGARYDPFPVRLMYGRGLPYANVAVGGASWTQLLNGDTGVEAATTRLYPQTDCSATKLILSMCGGTSDILFEADSAATVMADMVAYADAARTAGFTHVFTYTITPTTSFSAGQETIRQDTNTLLLADAGGDFDGVVDLTATGLETVDSTYYSDNLHFNVAGADLCAATAAPVLDAILAL